MNCNILKHHLLRLIPNCDTQTLHMIDVALRPQGKMFRSYIATEIATCLDESVTVPTSVLARLELLHYFTLIHDDIIDRSERRRSHDSIWKRFSPEVAILLGDLFHACSFSYATARINLASDKMVQLLNAFSRASAQVQLGQILEVSNLFNQDMPLSAYFRVAINKTSSLIYLASYVGWRFASEDVSVLRKLRAFSTAFGIAYQIYNDILDFENDHGKKACDDLKAGVMNLPLILYMIRRKKVEKHLPCLRTIASNKDNLERFVSKLKASGVFEEASDYCYSYSTKAENHLDAAVTQGHAPGIKRILETFKRTRQPLSVVPHLASVPKLPELCSV